MEPTLVLLASPLAGPSTWASCADALRARGRAVVVADPRSVSLGGPVVLVPHSNAGYYAPGLAARLDVVATVYVDAALAGPGPSTTLAPTAMVDELRALVEADGLLPPWTRWWPEESLTALFPDAASLAALRAEESRLPLSYFTSPLAVPDGWAERANAYLAFGDTYAEEIVTARTHGWPVEVAAGGHLQMLHDPAGVAEAVLRLEAGLRA